MANQFGGMKADYVKRMKELQAENARLKRMVADRQLELDALREIAEETAEPVEATPSRDPAAGTGTGSRSGGRAGSWASTAPPNATSQPS